jgi:S-adenosylmethionine:tRNA ribosyltransferase-isomerase
MRVERLAYDLPPERIAQFPAADREAARLMVLRHGRPTEHRHVRDLAEVVPPGSLAVVNDTRVIPARLIAQKDTGGRVEVFLVRFVDTRTLETPSGPRAAQIWQAMGKASKPLRFGVDMPVQGSAPLSVRLLHRRDEDALLEVALFVRDGSVPLDEAIRSSGRVPLPPYIKRDVDARDAERYQTVFARVDGAIAAPTAGLHLSHALLGRLAVRGVEIASVTLHVGLGTFQPVTAEDLDQHEMHSERYEVSRATAEAVAATRSRGGKVIAVGTTVVRALEAAAQETGEVKPTVGETALLIQPGHRFRAVDLLLTNFHLPRSTLLALVCAFGGTERILAAYAEAVREGYRFYSYGDAMFIEP